jgi:hypothetical protein
MSFDPFGFRALRWRSAFFNAANQLMRRAKAKEICFWFGACPEASNASDENDTSQKKKCFILQGASLTQGQIFEKIGLTKGMIATISKPGRMLP